MNVFVSRPNQEFPEHSKGLASFFALLKVLGLTPRTLGRTDTAVKAPLDEVISLLGLCEGAIILGLPQIRVDAGAVKGTPLASPLLLPTEWNHIEAALAYSRGLPLLLVRQQGIARGIFDPGALNRFQHEVDFADPAWSATDVMTSALTAWRERLRPVRKLQATGKPAPHPSAESGPVVDEDAFDTLTFFAPDPSDYLTIPRVAAAKEVSVLKAETLLDRLRDAKLIRRRSTPDGEKQYVLTSQGRALLVARGID